MLSVPPPRTTNGTPPAASSLLTRPLATGRGEGVDRVRRTRPRALRRLALAAVGLAVVAAGAWLALRGEGAELRVASERLTIVPVVEGPFQEYAAVTGTLRPLRTVFLDAVVGGQVARRLVDDGDTVRVGEPLFVLKNDDTALQVMSAEAQIEEQVSTIRAARLELDRNQLALQQQLAELDYEITRLERAETRTAGLAARGAAPAMDLEALRDELAYTQRRRELTLAAHEADQAQRAARLREMEASIGRFRDNLALVRSARADLVVRAPVDGQFSALAAEVGELKLRGDRLGQIDVLREAQVRAPIDEHYLSRVAPGQRATASLDGVEYPLRVRTVYPEVREGRFEVEAVFTGPPPPDLRRGQTLQLRLELGDPETARLLPRGAFYGDTGGRWVYVVAPDGRRAERREVTLGRQNPRHFEVLDGLRPGERVVVSSYALFGGAHALVLD